MAKKNKKENVSVQEIFTWIASIASIVALIIAWLTYSHTVYWDERMANIDSYKEQLNFKIEWEQTEDAATVETISYEPLDQEIVSKLPNQKMKVIATTGGVKAISALFYKEGDLIANVKIDLSDSVDQTAQDASETMYACEVLSLYPQIYAKTRNGGKYYTSLFVAVEGYNDDYYIVPTVFEFDADKAGKLVGDAVVREYNDFDTLYTYNESLQQIPDFDLNVLKDYIKLKQKLNA